MKIIGSLFIIISSVIASFYYEKSLKDSIKKTYALIDLISFIKNRIEYYSMPIDKILSEYETDNLWIKQIIDNKKIEIKHIDNNVEKDVNSFFSSIGKGYKKEQISLCDYTLKSLLNANENIKKDFKKKAKIYRSLSLFFGIGLVILLI